MTKKINLFAALLLFTLCLLQSCNPTQPQQPLVLLISFDGFSHDYVAKHQPPHFLEFIKTGTAAEHMLSSFPSKTFPNHYTLVTGMYPGHHGLVDNTFYDSARNVVYTMGQRELVQDAWYYGGTPLWQLAQQQGLKSASYFWVGSEAPVAGSYPDYYRIYDGSVPNEVRIDTVIQWLSLPTNERPQFVSLYFSLVDSEGHRSGPNSAQLKETVLKADSLLGSIMQKTDSLGLSLNIIVTSDHGMYELTDSPETLIYSGSLFGHDATIQYANSGAIVHVYEDDSAKRESLYALVKSQEKNFVAYRKEETPERWHYRQHARIGDLVLVANPGHYFKSGVPDSAKVPSTEPWGVHGYDPYVSPEMGAIFYANGPNIKTGLTISPFENVHVYPLIAKILKLQTPENIDGKAEVLEEVYIE